MEQREVDRSEATEDDVNGIAVAIAIADGFGFADIRDKVERAARNQQRLHLDPEQVRLLVRSPIWTTLAQLAAEEFVRRWSIEENAGTLPGSSAPPPAPSSGPSGSTGAKSAKSGRSPGTTTAEEDVLVESAERRRALRTVATTGSRRRRP